ncbi:MAG TPA: transcription factor S, partial [Candidatus Poseidoniales archaeon]
KEVIAESEGQGVLQEGSLMCPKCDCQRIYVELRQTRSSDEPETKIGTCADCGHKFREYA